MDTFTICVIKSYDCERGVQIYKIAYDVKQFICYL